MEPTYMERTVEMRTAYVVLLLLAQGPKTGYEVIKEIRRLLASIGVTASPGTVYPVLKKLEEEGYLEVREEPHGGRQRKVYRITEKGVEYLLRSAQRALEVLELAMRLHFEVVKNINARRELPDKLQPLLREILTRLEHIEDIAHKLVSLTRQFMVMEEKRANA
jgi:DNA-binding PadR family transcriptional regulator